MAFENFIKTKDEKFLSDLNKDWSWVNHCTMFKTFMKEHKITLNDISDGTGVTRTSMSHLFRTTKAPNFRTIQKIYGYFGFEFILVRKTGESLAAKVCEKECKHEKCWVKKIDEIDGANKQGDM